MRINRRDEPGGVTVLALAGEFDASNLPRISEGIDQLIRKGGTRLVFNLKGLKFINSSSLGYLITTQKRLREFDGDLVISEPSTFFQSIVATLGIDRIFKVCPSDDEAVKQFRGESAEGTTTYIGMSLDASLLVSTRLFFKLLDKPDAMAVAKILSIHEDGVTFQYPSDSDKVKIDPDELLIGRELWLKFQVPFQETERFVECQAEIVMAVDLANDPHRGAKYRVRYTQINPEDRAALGDILGPDDGDFHGGAGVTAPLRPRS